MVRTTICVVVGAVACSAAFIGAQSPAPRVPSPAGTPADTAAWTQPLEAAGPARLAIGARAVFVAHAAGVEAYAKADGKSLWSQPVAGITQLSALTRGDTVLTALTQADVIGLDTESGRELWRLALTQASGPAFVTTLNDGRVAVASGRAVQTIRRDGSVAWSATVAAPATTPLVEAAGAVWFGTEAPAFVRIDLASGAIASQIPLASPPLALSVSGTDVYVVARAPLLARYRFGENKPSWSWKRQRGLAELVGVPAVAGDFVFVAALDNTLHAFDRDSGSVKWRKPLPSRPAAGPREVDGFLLVPLMSGDVARLSGVTQTLSPFAEMTLEANARLQAAGLDAAGVLFTVVHSSRTNTLTAWRPAAPAK